MNRVSGKVALISGGARGMGAAHARRLVADAEIANEWRDHDLHGSRPGSAPFVPPPPVSACIAEVV